jgi:hypothetical protein
MRNKIGMNQYPESNSREEVVAEQLLMVNPSYLIMVG